MIHLQNTVIQVSIRIQPLKKCRNCKVKELWDAKCAPVFAVRFFALSKAIFDYLISSQFKSVNDYLFNK